MNLTRRSVLATGFVGLAGCLGGGDVEPGSEETDLGVPTIGDPDAPITVEVYEDFSCGFCQQFKRQLFPVIETRWIEPGEVRYERRDFPIPVDAWSVPVANAARAVQDTEGDEAFFTFTDEAYEYLGQYSYDRLATIADELGYDGAAVRSAAEEERYQTSIDADHARGESLGVGGTPTVVVEETIVEPDEDTPMIVGIEEAIEDAKAA